MLKYIRGVILCLVMLIASVCVSPTHAASADIMITQIQAGGSSAALDEMVIVYNNSWNEIDITDWCLKNKSNVSFACFKGDQPSDHVYLPGYHYATVASTALANSLNFHDFTTLYTVTNQSSGSIVGGGDTISLVTSTGVTVDSHNWTTSLMGGMLYARKYDSIGPPLSYLDTDNATDWQIQLPAMIPNDGVELRPGAFDVCSTVEGIQTEIPEGYMISPRGECIPMIYPLKLSELLPNAIGADEGNEFIELYNPNEHAVSLDGYKLWVGPYFEKSFNFPSGSSIGPLEYLIFTNSEIGYSLLNTSSNVRLMSGGEIIDEAVPYQDPQEDYSWAFIDATWQYTNRPTPNTENLAYTDGLGENESDVPSEQKPCAANQYRSPETNRCRLLSSSTSSLTPCKDGQYRSEETNRCRSIASDSNAPTECDEGEERNLSTNRCRKIAVVETPTPCKEGQERSPETNRCRTVKAITNADYAVLGTQTSNDGGNWYLWFAIGGVILLALAYAVWEWHYEIGKVFRRLVSFIRIRK